MNKIFKVIWSKSKQCYVVVSEMAKNKSGKKKIVVASILAAMVAGQAVQVEAVSGSFYDTGSTKGAIAIGKVGSTAPHATEENSIAIGQAAKSNGRGGVALGNESESKTSSVAVGYRAKAKANNTVAIGVETNNDNSISNNFSSVSIGITTRARAVGSMAMGVSADASGKYSLALGSGDVSGDYTAETNYPSASGEKSIAIGYNSNAGANSSISIGDSSSASQTSATAIGKSASADGLGSFAAGLQTNASGAGSVAIGGATSDTASNGATASGAASIAMGYKSNASSQNAVSIGSESEASELNALAIGTNANVTKQNATAVGSGASVTGHNATAVGNDTKAKKQYDNAFGYTSTASGGAATALGYYATASGNQAVALGSTINTTAQYATGIGYSVNSDGEGAVAIGAGTDAIGSIPAKQVKATAKNAIAIGRATQATLQDATAIGTEATASNTDAIAVGRLSNASGSTSIGLGYNTKATETNTVAIGTDVSATAESAIALGRKTTASALNATAVGPIANASGKYSSAFGMSAVASKENSLALGTDANASQASGVALGYSSTANTASGVAGYNPNTGRSDTYTDLSGKTLTSTLGAVSVGNATNTRQITNVAAGTENTDAVNVAQLKSVNLAFTGNSGSSDVNLSKSKLAVEGGTNSFITTEAANKKIEIKTTQGQLKNTAGTVSVDGNNGLAVAQNVADVINQANADQSIKYKANGAGNNSVKLSDGLNFTNGSTTTVTVGANGQVSFDLNTATKQSITDSATAVARTISLGGDTGTTTAKSLTSGNVNFGIKSGSSTYLTTTANGNDVTLTVNEQAIKNAAKDASSFKVKANSTAAADVKGGDTVAFNNGDNIAITQNGKTFTIGTSKNVTFDTATIGGNTTIGSTGVTTNKVTVGVISIDGTNGINAGNKAITNVGTGIVANSNADNSNVANIGDVKTIANDAVANLSTNLGVTDGTNNGTVNLKTEKLKVVGTGAATATVNGQTVTVDVAKGTLAANAATGALTGTAGVVDANDMATAVNTAITKAVDNATGTQALKIGGDTAATGSVNLKSDTLSVKGDNKFITTAASGNDITLTVNEQAIKTAAKDAASFKVKANSEAEQEVKGGETVAFNDGDNIEITQTGKTFKIATSKNVTFDTATIGGNTTIGSTGITTNKVTLGGISIDGTNGINAGGKQITNVASGGTTATNAANIGDINAAISSLTTNLGKNTTIAYKANDAGGQTVSLADGFNFTNGTLTTAEVDTSGVVKFNVTQGALSTDTNGTVSAGTAGVATTADVASAVNSAVSTAVNNATSSQKLDISDGTTDGAVNLKTQKLTVAGTGAATATLNNQTITVNVAEGTFTNNTDGTTTATAGVAKAADVASAINNANTALSKKITDATASVSTLGSNTFTLKADSTDTTAQALNKSGGLAFKVAGDSDLVSTSATADTVKVTVKKGTLTTNADGTLNKTTDGVVTADNMKTVVNDAITKAVTSAKDGSAWNISTNGGTATKVSGGNTVDLINGDNIEITQDGTDGKKITVKTKKDLTLDSVTAGNTVINTSGLTNGTTAITGTSVTTDKVTVGGLSIDKAAGINAGNKAITNVGTGIVANSNADNSNVANIGDVKTIANDAVANLSTNLGVTDGTNNGTVNLKTEKLKVVGTGAATATVNGQTVTVDVAKGTLAANAATGALTGTAGVVDANDMATAVNTAITKAVDNATGTQALKIGGDTAATGSVNLKSDTLSVKGDNKFITTAASGNDITLTVNEQAIKTAAKDAASFKVKANSEAEQEVKGGETVAFNDGDNIEITQTGKTFKIATSKNVTFDTATIGGNTTIGSTGITTNKVAVGGISIDGTNGINAGGKQITNVASGGTTATNAANIGDINTAISNLTTNLGRNTTIAYKANGTGGQTVSLADGFNFTNGTLTTAEVAANGVVKFNVTQGALSTDTNGTVSAGTAGVATTADVASAVNSAVSTAVNNATSNQKLDISAGGTDSSVNLKTQKLTVAGTGAATTSVAGQTITVNVAEGTLTPNTTTGDVTGSSTGVAKAADVASAINNANTALSKKITDATASVSTLGSNTFTLKADSTDTTAQALNKSGGLAFKVAGDSDLVSTSATADTVKVTVKKGTLTTNADGTLNKTTDGVVTADNMKTVVNDAITKAVTSAKDGSAWNISTNGGTATKVSGGNTVDLINGDNIEITQDGTDGKKITVKTKKDLTVDSVTAANTVKVGSAANLITLDGATGAVSGNTFTAGNASMNTTGFRLTGGPSVTTDGIDAGGKQITNMISGGTTATNAATIGDVDTKVGDAITNLTTNLTKNTNIAYTANGAAAGQTVSLKDGFNFTNGTLTTAEVGASGVVKFNVTQGALSTDTNGTVSAGTPGVATTADVASAVNSAVSTAVNNATSNQKLDISAGGTDSSVNLKTQKLTVAGTGAATASLNNQTITVNVAEGTFTNDTDGTTTATAGVAKAADVASAINNANTALSKKITDATASVSTLGSNTFTLKADSTDTTAQALNKSGGLAFKVAGDSDLVSTSATADTVKVTVKKGTLTTNADGTLNKTTDGVVTADNMKTVVNDAITKAVTSAKDGSAWNISTNGGTATKVSGGNTVDLINGDNIEITQDGTDGKKITVKTKKDLTVDSVTAANTVKVGSAANLITLDGATGAVSGNTFTAGNASMNTTGFRLTGGPSVTTDGIDAGGKQITNMISGGTTATNAATIGDVDTKVGDAITNLTTNLTKNTNIAYTANGAAAGQTVSLKDGFNFSDGTLTTAEVAANGVVKFNVTQGSLSTDANGNITNTGGVATTDDVKNAVTSAINTAVTKATGSQVLNITDGTNNGSINLKNDALKVVGADGVTTEVSGKTITVGLDTATKDKINNANTATNRNISLAADSGATSSQSLKDGDVSFAVKGATGDYISTNMNGSTVEISTKRATINSNATTGEASVTGNDGLATAKNVADAINAATTKAVAQSAWKLSADGGTTTETISGGDTVNFAAGKNIEITRTGKEIKVAMKDDVTFNKLNVGTGANAIGIDGTNGKITAKDIAATGDVSANNVTATGLVKGDTVQGNTMKAGNVTITGGTTNTITGLSNTTWTPAGGIQADRAATEGQLQQAINQVNATVGSTALTFKGDTNPAQSMTLQGNTFAITGDTMIKTTTSTNGIGLSLDTSKVNIAYAANGANGQTTSLTNGFNFTDGDHTKATVAANGVVEYDAKTSTITVANGQATASGTDLATADNVAHAINQMTQANAGNTTQLRQEINKVATETQRVGAHAAAMAALKPIQYDPLEPTQVMAGVGNYHGETAAALGLAHYTNENTMFNVGVSLGGNHNMVNAGVTHKFGSSPEKKNIPDRYKAGPISSIYVMQDEMTQLRTENESYKVKLDQQQSEIDALKAAVDKLLAAKA